MANRQIVTGKCVRCRNEMVGFYDEDAPSWAILAKVCGSCEDDIPESLLKATHDEFDYALGLENGTVIRFRKAKLRGSFVYLDQIMEWDSQEVDAGVGYSFDRGVDVRIESIVWCADAPRGS